MNACFFALQKIFLKKLKKIKNVIVFVVILL